MSQTWRDILLKSVMCGSKADVDYPKAARLVVVRDFHRSSLLPGASGELGEQVLIAIQAQKVEQVRKSFSKERDMRAHNLARLSRVTAKDRSHNLVVLGNR